MFQRILIFLIDEISITLLLPRLSPWMNTGGLMVGMPEAGLEYLISVLGNNQSIKGLKSSFIQKSMCTESPGSNLNFLVQL